MEKIFYRLFGTEHICTKSYRKMVEIINKITPEYQKLTKYEKV